MVFAWISQGGLDEPDTEDRHDGGLRGVPVRGRDRHWCLLSLSRVAIFWRAQATADQFDKRGAQQAPRFVSEHPGTLHAIDQHRRSGAQNRRSRTKDLHF